MCSLASFFLNFQTLWSAQSRVAAADYKRDVEGESETRIKGSGRGKTQGGGKPPVVGAKVVDYITHDVQTHSDSEEDCLLYTSDAADD